MRVVATAIGYYGGKRRDIDEVFGLKDDADFSKNWMKKVSVKAEAEQKPEPKPEPEPEPELKPEPEPIKASTETTVTPPKEPAKRIDPITGKPI